MSEINVNSSPKMVVEFEDAAEVALLVQKMRAKGLSNLLFSATTALSLSSFMQSLHRQIKTDFPSEKCPWVLIMSTNRWNHSIVANIFNLKYKFDPISSRSFNVSLFSQWRRRRFACSSNSGASADRRLILKAQNSGYRTLPELILLVARV